METYQFTGVVYYSLAYGTTIEDSNGIDKLGITTDKLIGKRVRVTVEVLE